MKPKVIRNANYTTVIYQNEKEIGRVNLNALEPKKRHYKRVSSFNRYITIPLISTTAMFIFGSVLLDKFQGAFGPVTYTANAQVEEVNIPPILKKVAMCESSMRQFDKNGFVLHGAKVHEDLGVLQINEKFWGKKAKELGYDLYEESGNWLMGIWLLEHYGTIPWSASYTCIKK